MRGEGARQSDSRARGSEVALLGRMPCLGVGEGGEARGARHDGAAHLHSATQKREGREALGTTLRERERRAALGTGPPGAVGKRGECVSVGKRGSVRLSASRVEGTGGCRGCAPEGRAAYGSRRSLARLLPQRRRAVDDLLQLLRLAAKGAGDGQRRVALGGGVFERMALRELRIERGRALPPPEAVRSSQKQPEAVRSSQKQPEAARSSQKQPEAI